MKVATSRFGQMEIPEDLTLQMPDGILGFPQKRRFAILKQDGEGTPFQWLQSLDSPELAFVVVDPRVLMPAYRIEFDEETVTLFGSIVPEDILPLVIVNVPRNLAADATVNLRAPILVHWKRGLARQIVLSNEDYSVDCRLLQPSQPGMPAQCDA